MNVFPLFVVTFSSQHDLIDDGIITVASGTIRGGAVKEASMKTVLWPNRTELEQLIDCLFQGVRSELVDAMVKDVEKKEVAK